MRVSTGDKTEHSTDAKVSIVFIGSDGVSEKIPLELIGKEGQFEAGSVETFSVESIDVGEVKKIEVTFLMNLLLYSRFHYFCVVLFLFLFFLRLF